MTTEKGLTDARQQDIREVLDAGKGLPASVTERNGIQYKCSCVRYKSKNVGLAPVRILKGENADDKLEDAIEVYGSAHVVKQLERANTTDSMNQVRAKFNKDKVSATTVINAIGSGLITAEQQIEAVADMNSGKAKNFTDACARFLGIGEDALKDVEPTHVHWDCVG